jgi:hypothetical protein
VLGSNSRRQPDPEHGENANVNKQMVGRECVKPSVDGNKCAGFLLLGESSGGLFIGVVRRSGNNVQTPP